MKKFKIGDEVFIKEDVYGLGGLYKFGDVIELTENGCEVALILEGAKK